MIAWISTESAEEASALLGSLRSQGYVAEIVAEREIEIQAIRTDSGEVVTGVDAPPVSLPVDHFVFCADRTKGSAEDASCGREFVLMPILRQIAWRSRGVITLLQNVLHAVRFIGRDFIEDLRQERSDLWASRMEARNSKESLPKTEQPIRSVERPRVGFGFGFRRSLPQTVGLVLASFVLLTSIVQIRRGQSGAIENHPATTYAHYSAVEPAITRASRPVRQSRSRTEFNGSVAASTTSLRKVSGQTSRLRMRHEEPYPEVIVHRYPSSHRPEVIASPVRHYSDLN